LLLQQGQQNNYNSNHTVHLHSYVNMSANNLF
jgi:hypothetical protein